MFQNLIYFSKNYKNTLFLYFYNFPMVQNCADQYGKGNRKDNSKASRKPLHNRDSNIIGIDDLLIRKVVSIVQKKHTYTASCKSKNQSIAVRSHHISCHMHSCLKKVPAAHSKILIINFIHGTAHRHCHIHNCTQTGNQKSGKKKSRCIPIYLYIEM